MAKVQFKYNPKTLDYDIVKRTWKQYVLRVLSLASIVFVIAAALVFVVHQWFPSPTERLLERENENLVLQMEIINKRLGNLSEVLGDLQRRDDDIYRIIFEAEPVPESVRKAGFGGVNRYKDLEGYANSQLIIETTKKVDKLSKQLYVQSRSFDDVFHMAKNKAEMLASIPAIQPIANKDLERMASGFGYRIHPIYKTTKMHTGMDFTATQGTEIYATGDGTVEVAENGRGYGIHVVINHGYDYQSLYGHMSRMLVKVGEKVKRGQVIGYVGSTGVSIGPHCHYEIIKNGTKVNPINYYYNDLSPEEYDKMIELASRSNQSFD
ncbi:MAG: M23 family metallopeptidase [Flavobacteriales bacterium]|nr:M23 family metallopeptidase [Flavobacteriales bacterium]